MGRARHTTLHRAGSVALAAGAAIAAGLLIQHAARADDDQPLEAPPRKPDSAAGFRMEGSAHVSVVFGDITGYREHVDRFLVLDGELAQARREFGVRVRAILGELAEARRGKCPTDAIAAHYARAGGERERFESAGAEFQARYRAIRELDAFGDTAGLTPDYRWKVNRARGKYRSALRDLHEMRVTFDSQLVRELRHKGCRSASLLAAAGDIAPPPIGDSVNKPLNPLPKPRRHHKRDAPGAVPAQAVTFYVDNTRCDEPVDLVIDGERMGSVQSRGRGAFRALAGRHSMCLLPASSLSTCGQQGTLRHAFIYDGWSISLHCLD